MDALESVQKKAARFVTSDWSRNASTTAMVSNLNWPTLQERRARARVIMFHKIHYGLVAIPISLFIPSSSLHYTRGAHVKYLPFRPRTMLYQNSFCPVAVTLWNSLDPSLTAMEDPESFRNALATVRLCP